jgi:hypothetical protein
MKINHTVWTEQWAHVDDTVSSKCPASNFCFVSWDSYSPISVQVHSQPKGIKPKMRMHILHSAINEYRALKLKGVIQTGLKQGYV